MKSIKNLKLSSHRTNSPTKNQPDTITDPSLQTAWGWQARCPVSHGLRKCKQQQRDTTGLQWTLRCWAHAEWPELSPTAHRDAKGCSRLGAQRVCCSWSWRRPSSFTKGGCHPALTRDLIARLPRGGRWQWGTLGTEGRGGQWEASAASLRLLCYPKAALQYGLKSILKMKS